MADTKYAGRVIDHLDHLIDSLDESQLGSSTPCEEWDVRALVNHVTAVGLMFATCIAEGSCTDAYLVTLFTEDQLGPDPARSFRSASTAFIGAAERASADTVTSTMWGEMSVSVVVDLTVADLAVHWIDLALATGADLDSLDADLLARADELAHRYFPAEGRGKSFGPPVEGAADAHPALKLARWTGRSV